MAKITEGLALKKLNEKLGRISAQLTKMAGKVPKVVTAELTKGGMDIMNTMRNSMADTPKSGKTQQKTQAGHIHHASLAGNPPAVDSGELRSSLHFVVSGLNMEVGSEGGAPYAEYLEYGTKGEYPIKARNAKVLSDGFNVYGTEVMHPGIEARPFLEPAVAKHSTRIITNIGKKAGVKLMTEALIRGGAKAI